MSAEKSGTIASRFSSALAILLCVVVAVAAVILFRTGAVAISNMGRNASGCEDSCLAFNGGRAQVIDGKCWCRDGKVYRRPVVR